MSKQKVVRIIQGGKISRAGPFVPNPLKPAVPAPTLETIKSLLMSPEWYARQVGCAPSFSLEHYESVGWKQGLDPHIFFDTKYVLTNFSDGETFNSPFELFCRAKARRMVASSPIFDLIWYSKNNADIILAGIDPFLHYIEYGAVEGRQPNPFYSFQSAELNSRDLFAHYDSIDDYIGQTDQLKLVTSGWLHQLLSVDEKTSHIKFWRGRNSGESRWPVNPEMLFGRIDASMISNLKELRSVLDGVCRDAP